MGILEHVFRMDEMCFLHMRKLRCDEQVNIHMDAVLKKIEYGKHGCQNLKAMLFFRIVLIIECYQEQSGCRKLKERHAMSMDV